MADVKLFHDREGQTLTVWLGDPSQGFKCEEAGPVVLLSKNRSGQLMAAKGFIFSAPKTVNCVVLDAR